MQRRHHQVGSINQRLIKLKQGQKTAFPFPLMVSPWLCKRQALISSLNPYSLPFFIPPTFCLPPETEPLLSVCTFFYSYVFRFGLQSVLLFAVLWFVWGQFYKSVFFLVLSDFTGYIKHLLFILLSSEVGIGYIVRYSFNNYIWQ